MTSTISPKQQKVTSNVVCHNALRATRAIGERGLVAAPDAGYGIIRFGGFRRCVSDAPAQYVKDQTHKQYRYITFPLPAPH
jgi:hypothetical protein